MREVILDGLFYAAITSILALSSRDFGFHNLASGMWVVVGGWLTAYLVGAAAGNPVPVNPGYFLGFAVLAAAQCSAPMMLRTHLRANPLAYLFLSLGVALVGGTLGTVFLLDTYGTTISLQPNGAWVLAVAATLLAILFSWIAFRTRRWASLVVRYRTALKTEPLWAEISLLLALELILLLAVGGAGFMIHKGIFPAAERYTIIPLLALVVTGYRVPRAPAISFVLIIISHLFDALLPGLAQFSVAAVIGILLIAAAADTPLKAVLSARSIYSPVRRTDDVPWFRHPLFSGVICCTTLMGAAVWLVGTSTVSLHQMMLGMVLVTVSWIAQDYLGVRSIVWPAIGVSTAYVIMGLSGQPSFVTSLVVLLSGLIWGIYIWWLRVLHSDRAMVIDLAVLVLMYQFAQGFTALSGIDNVRHFRLPVDVSLTPEGVLLGQLVGVIVLLSTLLIAGKVYWSRASIISLANFRIGIQHGFPAQRIFLIAATALVMIATSGMIAYHIGVPAVQPSELSLVYGLTILLLGNMMARAGAILAFPMVFTLYIVVDLLSGGWGQLTHIAIGLLFIGLAFADKVGEDHHV